MAIVTSKNIDKEKKDYIPSGKVIFSDKGSIYFGIFLIISMVSVSLIFMTLKFQKKAYLKQKSYSSTFFFKHRYILNPKMQQQSLFQKNLPKTNFKAKSKSLENS